MDRVNLMNFGYKYVSSQWKRGTDRAGSWPHAFLEASKLQNLILLTAIVSIWYYMYFSYWQNEYKKAFFLFSCKSEKLTWLIFHKYCYCVTGMLIFWSFISLDFERLAVFLPICLSSSTKVKFFMENVVNVGW